MSATTDFEHLGWRPPRPQQLADLGDPALVPGRVATAEHGRCHVLMAGGPRDATLAGWLADHPDPLARPAVGDWVALTPGDVVAHVLPRETRFVRKVAGRRGAAQLACANVDLALVVTTCGRDLNPRRIERYLAAIYDGGARAALVLNKVDLADDPAEAEEVARAAAPGVPVVLLSALAAGGSDPLSEWLTPGTTVVLLGSSGVGKSTLANRILGREALPTGEVREADQKGRHTTTRRTLEVSPGGVVLIDTPGVRELGLWHAEEGVSLAFAEIEALAEGCRFRDCGHSGEPGCAVEAAVSRGELDPARLEGYRRLGRELAHEAARDDPASQLRSKKRWKGISKAIRSHDKLKRDLGLKDG